MESYQFLLFLAIILFSTKLMGLFSRRVHMPAVVGALVAGVILGPSGFNIINLSGSSGEFLEMTAELGVIFLMFAAGLETDLSELKSNIVPSLVTAIIGVIVPLAGGFLCYSLYFQADITNYQELLKSIFIGVVLTATSVSITVETLRELGKLKGKVGTTILGAAVIDDILGIVVLTIVTGLKDTTVEPLSVLAKIGLYVIFIGVVGFVVVRARRLINYEGERRRTSIISIVFCLILSYVSERFFGIADITGAYFAGLMLCTTKVGDYVEERIGVASYLFFSPVFFASIGIKTSLSGMDRNLILFSLLLLIVAVLTKVAGCGLGARLCRYTNAESLQIGIGMISRGEVALIVAQKGYQYEMISDTLLAPIVLVVIITTLITPILLKVVMQGKARPAMR